MLPEITVRAESSQDVRAIREVHVAAFPSPAEASLVEALRNAGDLTVSLVAEHEERIVGHVAFSPVTLEDNPQNVPGLGLAPMAVVPEHQQRGIGSRLIREGLQRCQALGYAFVVVLGHPEYYPRFGFSKASQWGFTNEYGADEAFMISQLQPASVIENGGGVLYEPAFASLEEA